eukprot:CAMPEP_0172544092 /NCGR_PEP_ID=MMETSP1067-20121228/14324_1 /TAXON_ID=265564 ORGANISM="Thalassiosira punctigera, Strain Tpunct2005C2" /NCGR_SAMPLE_ID=MMETSP1067 /ASSEMBLY_ACC=CAM_ASM_000444 /LENGTH=52 /DNA_ID=CAMNT_0013330595 /DNA_START=20 /DNA_END=175 /DNA_ORIENTATION=-
MPDADASSHDDVGAPFVAASFHLRSVPHADSSYLGTEAAFFHLRSVPFADSS